MKQGQILLWLIIFLGNPINAGEKPELIANQFNIGNYETSTVFRNSAISKDEKHIYSGQLVHFQMAPNSIKHIAEKDYKSIAYWSNGGHLERAYLSSDERFIYRAVPGYGIEVYLRNLLTGEISLSQVFDFHTLQQAWLSSDGTAIFIHGDESELFIASVDRGTGKVVNYTRATDSWNYDFVGTYNQFFKQFDEGRKILTIGGVPRPLQGTLLSIVFSSWNQSTQKLETTDLFTVADLPELKFLEDIDAIGSEVFLLTQDALLVLSVPQGKTGNYAITHRISLPKKIRAEAKREIVVSNNTKDIFVFENHITAVLTHLRRKSVTSPLEVKSEISFSCELSYPMKSHGERVFFHSCLEKQHHQKLNAVKVDQATDEANIEERLVSMGGQLLNGPVLRLENRDELYTFHSGFGFEKDTVIRQFSLNRATGTFLFQDDLLVKPENPLLGYSFDKAVVSADQKFVIAVEYNFDFSVDGNERRLVLFNRDTLTGKLSKADEYSLRETGIAYSYITLPLVSFINNRAFALFDGANQRISASIFEIDESGRISFQRRATGPILPDRDKGSWLYDTHKQLIYVANAVYKADWQSGSIYQTQEYLCDGFVSEGCDYSIDSQWVFGEEAIARRFPIGATKLGTAIYKRDSEGKIRTPLNFMGTEHPISNAEVLVSNQDNGSVFELSSREVEPGQFRLAASTHLFNTDSFEVTASSQFLAVPWFTLNRHRNESFWLQSEKLVVTPHAEGFAVFATGREIIREREHKELVVGIGEAFSFDVSTAFDGDAQISSIKLPEGVSFDGQMTISGAILSAGNHIAEFLGQSLDGSAALTKVNFHVKNSSLPKLQLDENGRAYISELKQGEIQQYLFEVKEGTAFISAYVSSQEGDVDLHADSEESHDIRRSKYRKMNKDSYEYLKVTNPENGSWIFTVSAANDIKNVVLGVMADQELRSSAELTPNTHENGFLYLGAFTVGSTAEKEFILKSTGTTSILDIEIRIEKPYSVSHDCPKKMEVNQLCRIVVRLDTSSPGELNKILYVSGQGVHKHQQLSALVQAPLTSAPPSESKGGGGAQTLNYLLLSLFLIVANQGRKRKRHLKESN